MGTCKSRQQELQDSSPLELWLTDPSPRRTVHTYAAETAGELLERLGGELGVPEAFVGMLEMSFSDQIVDSMMSLERAGLRSGAEIMVRHVAEAQQALRVLWSTDQHRAAVDALIPRLLRCNPDTTESALREGLRFDVDGVLVDWDLSRRLSALPEEFGGVRTTRDLWLQNNQLRSLPESFGEIIVGGDLYLHRNHLESLPESFGQVTVHESLDLSANQLMSLPDSFGAIRVGGDLVLHCNGKGVGPVMSQAAGLVYPGVAGHVWCQSGSIDRVSY
eukprot:TRINITY_DN13081_c0_g1_i1.p1 TRINITY_DN13081_c0_g1~~TRINITY_DN13081_c0_g1_i1.p1  ORF type:complete len:276 (-),score=46.55 TRINITY_DN13081_c0_g1_i1:77-904(-)